MNSPWIFFDFDGTLVNSLPVLYQSYLDFLSAFKKKGNKEEFKSLNGPGLSEVVEILKKKYSLSESRKTLEQKYKSHLKQLFQNEVQPIQGAGSLLNFCQTRYSLGLVTSNNLELTMSFLHRSQWDSYFDVYVFGDEVHRSKPHPEIYKKALEKSKASPNQLFVIEDSPKGIQSAVAAGLKVLGVNGLFREKELYDSGAFKVFPNLKKVNEFLMGDIF